MTIYFKKVTEWINKVEFWQQVLIFTSACAVAGAIADLANGVRGSFIIIALGILVIMILAKKEQ